MTIENKDKIILSLCSGTGSWEKPCKEAGYDVRSITLPEHDVLTYKPPDNVYGILAAPPCTEFSIAKGGSPRDFESAIKIVEACLKIIWKCRINNKLIFWALENPRGYLRQFIGQPHFTFQHWQFDKQAPFIKPTDIWGYFTEPRFTNLDKPKLEVKTGHAVLYGAPKCPEEYKHLSLNRAAIRAITPPGFAKAFYKANK